MNAPGESTPAPASTHADPAALLDGEWVLVPATQTMHDGTVLRTYGVQANGIWVGRVLGIAV